MHIHNLTVLDYLMCSTVAKSSCCDWDQMGRMPKVSTNQPFKEKKKANPQISGLHRISLIFGEMSDATLLSRNNLCFTLGPS